jgi:hypothetical protein
MTFAGFDLVHTTAVPNTLFDELLPILNEAQLKVLMYVIRRTSGFNKVADAISLRQFRNGITTKDGKKLDNGCGLKNYTTIIKAATFLEQSGYIECEKGETTSGDASTTVYRLRSRGTAQNGVPTASSGVGVLRQTEHGPASNGVGVLRQTEQQKIERQKTVSQKIERQDSDNPNVSAKEHSLPPSSQNSLLSSLTEEESTFWLRWCAISQSDPDSLNPNAHKHVKFFAEKSLNTSDLQALYDAAYDRIREFSQGTGKTPVPPRLGNLVKVYPEWSQGRVLKSRDQEQDRKSREHLPGTGRLRNYTKERMDGNAPLPLTYAPQSTQRRDRSKLEKIDFNTELAKIQRHVPQVDSE